MITIGNNTKIKNSIIGRDIKKEKELQIRIDKAIKYIENNYDNATYTYSKDKDIYCKCFDDLLKILKGENNE